MKKFFNKNRTFCKVIINTIFFLLLVSCSNSDNNTAGILIETNTGNKQVACILISVKETDLKAGYTITIPETDVNKVIDSLEVLAGVGVIENIPVGTYDSIIVVTPEDSSFVKTIYWNVIADTLNYDTALHIGQTLKEQITLKNQAGNFMNANEDFLNMPVKISVPSRIQNPCLLDINNNLISLIQTTSGNLDTNDYFGIFQEITIDRDSSVHYTLLENCQATNEIDLKLARKSVLFDDEENGALALDSTMYWRLIENFKPFEDDYNMTVSFNLALKDTQPASEHNIRILSAKADSVGFIFQLSKSKKQLSLRLDTGNDNFLNQVFYYPSVEDENFHSYAACINNGEVTLIMDGEIVLDSTFLVGNGFKTITNPAIGYEPNFQGTIDDIFFFDGKESKLWLQMFHSLQ